MAPKEDAEHYHGYSVDTEDQPQSTGDSNAPDRGLRDPLEEGYSPPERWSAGQGTGNTAWEEEHGESLTARVDQEEPEADPRAPAAGENVGGEVGGRRAGRLVSGDAGARPDTDKDMTASDVGIDGAGASAEEAAVHVIDEENA